MSRLIAFGDIHGCYEAATKAVHVAHEKRVQAIFLGDYVDRGPSAVKTLRVLMAAKEQQPDWIFLRGNHDQMLLDLIKGKVQSTDFGKVLGFDFGYSQAAKSYEEWLRAGKAEQIAIFEFLNTTQLYYETDEFIFSHAVIRNTEQKIHEKSKDELIWNYSYEPFWEGKRFVHGHLPVKQITEEGQGININTSCGYGGILTGLIINESDPDNYAFNQIHENGSLVKS